MKIDAPTVDIEVDERPDEFEGRPEIREGARRVEQRANVGQPRLLGQAVARLVRLDAWSRKLDLLGARRLHEAVLEARIGVEAEDIDGVGVVPDRPGAMLDERDRRVRVKELRRLGWEPTPP